MSKAYEEAGVNIDAGNEAVERIKKHVQKTFRNEVKSGIGGFGGLFALKNYENPILVSGTDGVGTKLKIAFAMDDHSSVGIDLVAMCVNDILVQGAEPLFFLDYIATGRLQPEQIEELVMGIAEGCMQANCSLIGGETAEMPSLYKENEYDLAGFTVGAVEEDKLIDGATITDGDIIIGLASNGVHSNGYSLVRDLLFNKNSFKLTDYIEDIGSNLGEELIKPTRIYVKPILELIKKIEVKGMAHITGGGLLENIPRILPEGLQADIQIGTWDIPAIFSFLEKVGHLQKDDLFRTFNMGIGFALIVSKNNEENVLSILEQLGEKASVIGHIRKGANTVHLT